MKTPDRSTTLWLDWSKKEDDLTAHFPGGSKPTGGMLCHALGGEKICVSNKYGPGIKVTILEALEERGYDIKTLKLVVRKKTEDYQSTPGEKHYTDPKSNK